MSGSFSRRAFLAGGAAAAGAVAGGSLFGQAPAGAADTNGPGRNGISSASPKYGGALNFGTDAEEQGFDPTSARYDQAGFMYARTVFDPVAIVTADGGWKPYLAQSIVPNDDYTVWTITLRPRITFHDGTPCDSAALLTNAEKQIASSLTGPAIKSFVTDVTPVNSLSLQFKLTQPWVSFPYALADSQLSYVAAPSMLNSPSGTTHPVGTGPFVFGEWIPNSHYTSNRNPHYWRKGLPYLDSITFKPVVDPDARAEALQSGEIDMMYSNTPQNIVQFRGNKQWSYVDDTGVLVGEPDINCIQLNCHGEPFSNVTLRRAMAMATNVDEYIKVISLNIGAAVNGPFTKGTPYYTKTPYPAYDPQGAKALVRQVAQQTGKPVAFTLQLIPDPEVERAAEFFQQNWQAAGMHVDLSIVEQATLIDNALTGNYQAVTWRQFGASQPDLNYVWWSTQTATVNQLYSINMARNVDPRIQAALLAARSAPTQQQRIKQYQKVDVYLGQDVPYVWLNRSTWAVMSQPTVQNWNNPTAPDGTKALGMHLGVTWLTQTWMS